MNESREIVVLITMLGVLFIVHVCLWAWISGIENEIESAELESKLKTIAKWGMRIGSFFF